MVEQEKQQDEAKIETNWFEQAETFDDLNIKEELLRGIYGYGYEKPSVI